MDADDKRKSVPELLWGCWTRDWIRLSDGQVDDTTTVVWVQLASRMADVRLSPAVQSLRGRGALSECSTEDLRLIALSDSSSGYTTCTPVEHTATGRLATAQWFTGDQGVAFQPVSSYPEPGLLSWADDDDVMIEQAPSGAYTERWIRTPESGQVLSHSYGEDGSEIFRAGAVAVRVRDRRIPVPRAAALPDLIAELQGSDEEIRQALINLVDCEFSVGEQSSNGAHVITTSTLPWLIGDTIDVP